MAPTKTNATKQEVKTVVVKKAAKAPVKKAVAEKKVTKVVKISTRKAYTRPQFRRPHTFRKPATVKPGANLSVIKNKMDQFRVIKYPLVTEMAMKKIEENSTLTFIVDPKANKTAIKQAMRSLYQVKTAKVNTLIRPDGLKKAYIRVAAVHDALDIASKIGIV